MGYNIGNIAFLIGVGLLMCYIEHSLADDPTSPPVPKNNCSMVNDSCESCLKNVSCMWCNNPRRCMDYPYNSILPTAADCALSKARWGVCWLNFEAMIISVSVIGGVLLIAITLCFCKCCGCFCFKKPSQKYAREEARIERERQERNMRQSERKQERQRRNDDIRRKYGLGGTSNQYERFDNEATA